jgi:hypothetical protein
MFRDIRFMTFWYVTLGQARFAECFEPYFENDYRRFVQELLTSVEERGGNTG